MDTNIPWFIRLLRHLLKWGVGYIALVVIVLLQSNTSMKDIYNQQTALVEASENNKKKLSLSDKIKIEDIETEFTEPNEIRLVFSYDSAPCRLFHHQWPAISRRFDVDLSVKQVPVNSSRFMTDTVLKAHAISEQIDFTNRLNEHLYHHVLEENKTLNTLGQLHDWFLKEGVNNYKLINYLSNNKTSELFEAYQLVRPSQIPSIIVGGKKIIYFDHDVSDDELVETVNYLSRHIISESRVE